LDELLGIIDSLYGRDNLKFGASLEDVRKEALDQIKREFTDTDSKEYQDSSFWVGLSQAMAKSY
jgi:hypothetical protein